MSDLAFGYLRHFSSVRARRVLAEQHRGPRPTDEIVTAFRDGAVTLRSNRRTDGFTNALQEVGYQGVRAGDLVVHSMDGFAGAIGVSDSVGKMSPVVQIYAVRGGDPRYVAYALRAMAFSGYVEALAKGIRERSTSFDRHTVAGLDLPWPSLEQQHRIADFLDDQVARIDEIIRLRLQQIQAIRARFGSMISDAVTGVTTPGPRVETGVPWLGAVPTGWVVLPIKRLGRSFMGLTYSPDDLVDSHEDGTLVLRSGNIQGGRIVLNDNVHVKGAIPARAVTRAGDILICARNGSAALIGKNAVITADIAGAAFGAFMTVLRSPVNPYLRWVLNSQIFTSQLGLFATTTINQLTREALENLVVAVPPAATQTGIVHRLSDAEELVSDAIRVIESDICLFQERKRSLITAAVTGEFDVSVASGRGVA